MRLSRFSLKLIGSFIAFAIGPAAILAVLGFVQVLESDRNAHFGHLGTAASARAEFVEACLEEHRARARAFAESRQGGAPGEEAAAPPEVVVVPRGGTPSLALDEAGVKALRAGEPWFAGDRVLVGAPLADGGAAVVPIEASRIEGYLAPADGIGRTGRIFLVDGGGTVRSGVARGTRVEAAPGNAEMTDRQGVVWLRAAVPAGRSLVVAEIQRNEALGPVRALAWRLLGLGAIFFLLVIGALILAAGRMERGLRAVAGSIESAGRGEFGAHAEVATFEWLVRLQQSMNETLQKLAERDGEILRQRQELFCQRCELERLNAEIVQADRMKSQFIANMSHEVRTPLHSVLSLSDLLLNEASGRLTDEQRRQVGIIERNGRRLHEMLGDILDFSKIEAGRMTVSPVSVAPAAVLAGVREAVAPLADAKGLRLVLDVPDDLPPIVSDAEKLHRVILNLAHNAVKFTKEGSVTLSASARPAGGVELLVRDTGPGIPESQMGLLFQPFRQLDGSTTRVAGGTGLGLSISKSLVELLGGRISVESKEGEGSLFRVTLPARSPARAPGGPRPLLGESDVLVVGASPAAGDAVRAELQAAGFHAGRAVCGRDVRNAIDRTGIGAVLLDVGLFAGEGIEVFRGPGARLAAEKTPILAFGLDVEAGRGSFLGRAVVEPDGGGGLRLEFERAEPLHLPDPLDEKAKADAAAWARRLHAAESTSLHELLRELVRRLDPLLARSAAPAAPGAGPVLLVDPDPDSRYSTSLQLERIGYTVKAVPRLGDAPEGLRPGVVVMESADSPAAARARYDAPVVVLTADARAEAQTAAMREGAAAFLTKPVATAALRKTVSGARSGS